MIVPLQGEDSVPQTPASPRAAATVLPLVEDILKPTDEAAPPEVTSVSPSVGDIGPQEPSSAGTVSLVPPLVGDKEAMAGALEASQQELASPLVGGNISSDQSLAASVPPLVGDHGCQKTATEAPGTEGADLSTPRAPMDGVRSNKCLLNFRSQ